MRYKLIEPVIKQDLPVVERLLTNRGIPLNEVNHYLNASKDDVIEPASISRIRDGVIMLIQHIRQSDKIFVQVDSDADGMTSAATLINYLYCLFPDFVQTNVCYRLHTGKQHGIVLDTIPKDTKLVIIPDAGSNQFDEHKQLQEMGIDVLVIDHHEADQISDYACIINNQLCDYPTKSLSGVGMVYKFCSYIDEILGASHVEKFLDLVAIGLIADMVDIRDFETRYFINQGLSNIRNSYLKEMFKAQNYSIEKHGGPNPFTVGFYIAPYINAVMRVGTQEEKVNLFQSMLDFKGNEQIPSTKKGCKGQTETRVEQTCRNCVNVKNRQANSVDASLEKIEWLIKEKNLLENKVLLILLEPEYAVDKNITGLIANKLVGEYQIPTLILNKVDENNSWEGSGRGYGLESFRCFLEESGLVLYAQGHANAFGCGIAQDKIQDFIRYTNNALKDFDFTPQHNVDFIWQPNELNDIDIIKIARLEWVWGQEIARPYVAVENISVYADNINLLKGSTLKITLQNGITLIKFGSSEEEYESLYSDLGCVTINVVGECKENVWNGISSPQIEVKALEIVNKQEYYF